MADNSIRTETPTFIKTQMQFSQHIRDPENVAPPSGIEDRRMNIYRDLFYNNVEGFIASGFPVIRSIYSAAHWHKMIRDFFIKHRCQTPYFLQISEEFLSYLQNERTPQAEDPTGLIELAHYEWVELALSISTDDCHLKQINPNGDLLEQHPIISPLAWSLAYTFPVHRMSPDFLPTQPPEQATYLIVYRDRLDDIQFMEINAVTAQLLHLINQSANATGKEILLQIAEMLNAADHEMIVNAGLASLQQLQARGIILGTSR
ncbi:MAG: putative DNA-binding domain-containing protein [Gammaproteobacteria bacterium]|nr:putative DNA-binding domain-containing protein [Gammaproteobacteria bacterium]